jgi:hypothetical protein
MNGLLYAGLLIAVRAHHFLSLKLLARALQWVTGFKVHPNRLAATNSIPW